VSRVWYCAVCGYEVDRGGRCHNCKEALIESPLAELAESDSNDEVGYRLTDWDDSQRGQLIEALIEGEVLHRFEGDELVVTGDDEAAVDALVGQIGGGLDGQDDDDGQADEATVEALESLLHAARRLRIDPTDMAADGELAESAAEIFAIDHVYGVDGEVWASIGRVTRRLLAALGADIALEDEISSQAAVLCRLVEPIVSPQDTDAEPWRVAQTARMATTYHPPPLAADDGSDEAQEGEADDDDTDDGDADDCDADDGDAQDGEAGDRHQVVYDLADWLPEERAQLDLLLEREGIGHWWEGTDVVVAEVDWDQVDALFTEVGRSGEGPLEPVEDPEADDEEDYRALSELFGAADRLAGDPDDKAKRKAFADAAAFVADAPVPFGMSDDQWWRIKSRVRSLTDSIDVGAGAVVIRDSATTLSDLLRGFV
jgi:hypothetical protein